MDLAEVSNVLVIRRSLLIVYSSILLRFLLVRLSLTFRLLGPYWF